MKKNLGKLVTLVALVLVVLATSATSINAEQAWVQDSKGWRYGEDGSFITSNWAVIADKTYYFDASGYMVTGWNLIDGNYYYFDDTGYMVTGWLSYAGNWYYLAESGAMQTGWINDSDKWYYLDSNGVMLTGWQKINGAWRYLNPQGVWINDNSSEIASLKGIDVSYWQGTIDWDKVKADGIEFAFIRVGHGARNLDSKFVQNVKEANRVGIPVGVYFYSTAQSVEQSILDAQFVLESIQGYTISYPVVIDVEDNSQAALGKQTITEITKAFCDEIRLAGYTPMVYCNENWYRNYVDFSQLGDVERWIARYSVKPASDISRDIWQAGSTTRIDGINGNVDIDFGYTNYATTITPRTSWDSSYVKTTGVWKQDSKGYWYAHLDGTYTTNDWELINGKWYFFNGEGYNCTNQWISTNNEWFYVDENGSRVIGWRAIGDKWYYFDANGKMTSGWQYVNGLWYYLGAANDGAMKTGWQVVNGNWYYLGTANDGAMKTGWQYIGDKWYYFGDANDGAMKCDWQYINGKWYYFGNRSDGSMKSGWQYLNNRWYYLGDVTDGAMKTDWVFVGGKWYFLYEDGHMAANTWVGNYYVNASGEWTQTR